MRQLVPAPHHQASTLSKGAKAARPTSKAEETQVGMSNSGQTPRRGGGDIDETVLTLVSQMGQGFLDKVRASQPGVGLLS